MTKRVLIAFIHCVPAGRHSSLNDIYLVGNFQKFHCFLYKGRRREATDGDAGAQVVIRSETDGDCALKSWVGRLIKLLHTIHHPLTLHL